MRRLLAIIGNLYGKLGFQAKLWIVAIVLALASLTAFVKYERDIGRREVLLVQSQASEKAALKSLAIIKVKADSLLRVDSVQTVQLKEKTKIFQGAATRYKTIRDTLKVPDEQAILDAFDAADEAVATAESALDAAKQSNAAKDAVIANLNNQLSARDSIESALREQNKILRTQTGAVHTRFGAVVKWAEIGAAGYVGYRVGRR